MSTTKKPKNTSGTGTVIISGPNGTATYTNNGSYSSTGNITLTNGGYVSPGYGAVSGGITPGTYYTATGGGGGYGGTWTTAASITNPAPRVKISDGDIELDGVSIAKTMVAIQDRLAILVPKPELLEKYEALKQAYDHYKMLEALCTDSAKDADK